MASEGIRAMLVGLAEQVAAAVARDGQGQEVARAAVDFSAWTMDGDEIVCRDIDLTVATPCQIQTYDLLDAAEKRLASHAFSGGRFMEAAGDVICVTPRISIKNA